MEVERGSCWGVGQTLVWQHCLGPRPAAGHPVGGCLTLIRQPAVLRYVICTLICKEKSKSVLVIKIKIKVEIKDR